MNLDLKKLSKKISLILFISFVGIIMLFGFFTYKSMQPINSKDTEYSEFTVEKGWGLNKTLEELDKKGFINYSIFLKIYVKLNDFNEVKAGTYELSKSMNFDFIINTLTKGNSIDNKQILVKFIEGKRFVDYAKVISDNFDYTQDEIIAYAANKEYLARLVSKYWFIDESILNDDLYYPLEGYLFPDTYYFKENSTIEEIFAVMLDELGSKLSPYENDIKASDNSVHSLLTLASMVELEALSEEDRGNVAGVFYNRLNKQISLGSDVTTYYAAKKELFSSLTMSDLNDCNKYNTRGLCVPGLPVGPICSPSLSSVKAAINPTENDYLFFVADKNNKAYFAKTQYEHEQVIRNLKNNGLWPE